MRKELGGMTNGHAGIRRLLAREGLTGSKRSESASGVEEEDKNKPLEVFHQIFYAAQDKSA